MLLILCHCGAGRYAVESRHVREVLPRAQCQPLAGAPPWLAGILICRGEALPVIDLGQLAEGRPCAARLSSRIVVLRIELGGTLRHLGLLAERVELRETGQAAEAMRAVDGPAALGTLRLDDEGVFQLLDPARLLSPERQAVLFPAVETHA